MKILFVCNGNVGRSQVAMEFWNQIHPGEASSAGLNVKEPGQTLAPLLGLAQILTAMQEAGIDMAENVRTQLTPDLAAKFGKVVILANPETIPGWLANKPDSEVWQVEAGEGKTLEQARKIRDEIQARVTGLDRRLHPEN